MDSLPGELLQEILLRVRFASVFKAKQVCRTWNRIVGCQGFTDKYISREKFQLVETDDSGWISIDVRDSNGNIVLRFPDILFCEASCPTRAGFRIGMDRTSKKLYAADIFKNKWLEIPKPPNHPGPDHKLDNIAVVASGNGRNVKLVNWDVYGRISVMGKRVWTCHREQDRWDVDLIAPSAPAVLGGSMFRMDPRRKMLLRYNIPEDKYSEVAITSEARFSDVWRRQFVVSEDRLYLLQQASTRALSLWNISTGDGVATLIMDLHAPDMVSRSERLYAAIKDNRLEVQLRGMTIRTMTYNMTTKCFLRVNNMSPKY